MADSRLPLAPNDLDLSQSSAISFMVGVYVAVNAIADLFLLVEGPDCTYMKTQYVQGNHDWMSTLTSVSGTPRIANTALHPSQMSGSRERSLQEVLLAIASHEDVRAVALTSMPMAFITGADYDRLTRDTALATGKRLFHIPGKSLSGDWLDGYSETLLSLAKQVELPAASPRPRSAAIVGYLFDRNEDDHLANLDELRRIFGALGIELCSVWLSGGTVEDLSDVQRASTILSLPYGRKAAQRVARRLGVPVVDMPLPVGFQRTEQFVRKLGELFSVEERASAFIDAELAGLVPRLEWVVPFVFQNRTVGFVGEPHVLPGIYDIVSMLGATLRFALVTNRPSHAAGLSLPGTELVVHPRMKTLSRFMREQNDKGGVDLLISNNVGITSLRGALLEFGFPSYLQHALYDRPFLGFRGAVALIDSMASAIRMHELQTASLAFGRGLRHDGEVLR